MDYEVFLSAACARTSSTSRSRARVDDGFVSSARSSRPPRSSCSPCSPRSCPTATRRSSPSPSVSLVGVAIDAFLVRMTLIPAVLVLFGRHAWWIPAWLDRTLPRFDVEGEGLAEEFALADWPAPGIRPAIAAEGVRIAGADDLEVGAMVDDGEALVVHGGTSADRAAVLLALSARTPVVEGRLKVAGLVLPARRRPSARAPRTCGSTTARPRCLAVRDALDSGARILMLDTVDGIADPGVRSGIRELLARARRDTGGRSRDQEPRRRPHARDRRRRPRERTRPAAHDVAVRTLHLAPTPVLVGVAAWRPAPSRRPRERVTSYGSQWSACSRCRCSSAASSRGARDADGAPRPGHRGDRQRRRAGDRERPDRAARPAVRRRTHRRRERDGCRGRHGLRQ